jgi:N-methylhydantoinase B
VITPVDHTTEFSGVGERFRHPPWGLDGGRPGGTGRFRIRRADGDTETLPGKITGVRCRAGEAVIIETPGAGGYGPPGERAAEAVAADLRGGKISPGFAARYYPQAAAGDGPRETNDPDDNRETDR